MGRQGTGHLFRRGAVWWVRYVVDGRRVRESLGTADEAEARRRAAAIVAPVAARRDADQVQALVDRLAAAQARAGDASAAHRAPPLALDDVWARYPYEWSVRGARVRKRLSPRNVEENRGAWGRFVRWAAGEGIDEIDQVTAAVAARYAVALEREGLSAGRRNKLLTTAGVMLRLAGREDVFAAVPRWAVVHERREALEVDQVQAVLAQVEGELRLLVMVGLYTGLRLGDAATLEWGRHVDLVNGRIARTAAKTGRVVAFPLHPVLAEELAPIAAARGPVLPGVARDYRERRAWLCQQVRRAFERAGITAVEGSHARYTLTGRRRRGTDQAPDRVRGISRYGFHSLRHTFVTLCARGGVPQGLVREWVGHSSGAVTAIYEHWGHAEQARVLAALPDVRPPTVS